MHLEHEKVSAEEVVVEGVAFDQIISHAETCNTNVIVVGSGAGADGSRLGITAERVCRKALKPVWVVSPGGPGFPRSILCPVDFSKPSAQCAAERPPLGPELCGGADGANRHRPAFRRLCLVR